MREDQVWYSEDIPPDIPTRDNIVASCVQAGFNRNGVYIAPRFWVKYGDNSVTRGEGRTQAHVARIVNDNTESVVRVPEVHLGFSRGWCGYTVMDFVRGSTPAQRKAKGHYRKEDIRAVAAAILQFTNITMPAGSAPGPVGGGLVGHDFFVEGLSAIRYITVGDLETQINNALRPSTNGLRVDFQAETANGLVLCPSDPNDSNFMIDNEEKLWAIDFGRTWFLPRSFVSYSLMPSSNVFVQRVAHRVNYPLSVNFKTMTIAAGQLVIFNDNALGTRAARPPSGSARIRPRSASWVSRAGPGTSMAGSLKSTPEVGREERGATDDNEGPSQKN